MIRINLLPVEKRKAERTPLPRFILIASTAAAATIIIAGLAFIYFEIRNVETQIADQREKLRKLEPKLAEFTFETQRKERNTAKLRELQSVLTREVEFWRPVNALWEVIHIHPKVWVDDIKILDEKTVGAEIKKYDPESKAVPAYGVTMRCNVAGTEVPEMTRFRNALKAHPVLMETLPLINFNVDWAVKDEKDYQEKHSIAFVVSMVARPALVQPTPKGPAPVRPPQPAGAGGAR